MLPILLPKICHSPEDAVGPRLVKHGFTVTRLIVAASHKPPNRHAGRLGCRYAADAVLNHQRTTRIRLHPFGGVKKEVGRWLAAFHHLRAKKPAFEMRRETGQGKREGYSIDIAGGGDAVRDPQAPQHRAHTFNRAKSEGKRITNPCPQLG